MLKKQIRDAAIQHAKELLQRNTVSFSGNDPEAFWTQRKGPWGYPIKNLLIPGEAGDFISPDQSTFRGQWYWDTLGINTGLLRSGDKGLMETAKSMTENLFVLYQANKLIPNAADNVQNTRSQPPFLSTMCLEIHELYDFPGGMAEKFSWLKRASHFIKQEVKVPWESHANDSGFRWFDDISNVCPGISEEEVLAFFRPESRSDFRVLRSLVFNALRIDLNKKSRGNYPEIKRICLKAISRLNPEERKLLKKWLYSRRLLVSSGMDFTAAYGVKPLPESLKKLMNLKMLNASDWVYSMIEEVIPVDLNCFIYKYYADLAIIADKLGEYYQGSEKEIYKKETAFWNKKKETLKKNIVRIHWDDKDGVFWNACQKTGDKLKSLPHLTLYTYPLLSGVVDCENVKKIHAGIEALTTAYGLKCTEEITGFQWDYNMWPLQTWLTAGALAKYSYIDSARKIREGYLRCAEKVFREKGSFFEKYNADNGTIDTVGRYPAAPDFSWGASVYLAFADYGDSEGY